MVNMDESNEIFEAPMASTQHSGSGTNIQTNGVRSRSSTTYTLVLRRHWPMTSEPCFSAGGRLEGSPSSCAVLETAHY
jgi:hypothetical protein